MTTAAEMTTTDELPETEDTFNTSMEEQERQLGETAKTAYLEAGEKKKAALTSLREWEQFFAERGINPQVQINRMLSSATAQTTSEQLVAQMPPKSDTTALPQHNKMADDFVTNYIGNHTQGFTVVELINAAIADKIIADNTKENREPILLIVHSLKNNKKIIEAPNKRNNETVYLPA